MRVVFYYNYRDGRGDFFTLNVCVCVCVSVDAYSGYEAAY